jgi:hypothetical protein
VDERKRHRFIVLETADGERKRLHRAWPPVDEAASDEPVPVLRVDRRPEQPIDRLPVQRAIGTIRPSELLAGDDAANVEPGNPGVKPESPQTHQNESHYKPFPGSLVEEIVRRATDARDNGSNRRNLARTLANELADELHDKGASRPMALAIFKLMKVGWLADAGCQGSLKIDGVIVETPSEIRVNKQVHDLGL